MVSVIIKITIAYIVGMLAAIFADLGFGAIFAVCLAAVSLGEFFVIKLPGRKVLCSVFFMLGFFIMSAGLSPSSSVLGGYLERYVELQGVICEVPDRYSEYYSYVLSVEKMSYNDEVVYFTDKVRVTSQIELDTGNRVAVRGFLRDLSTPDNSTEFDYRPYYYSRGIHYRLHADEAELITPKAFMFSFGYAGEYLKSRISFAIDKFFEGDSAAMLKAVLTGSKTEFSSEFKKTLIRSSAIRFLYPSYLHMFLIVALCEFIFAAFNKKKRQNMTLIFIAVWALLNSSFYAFIRMGMMLALGIWYRRKRGFSHYPDMASAVILIFLLANPLLLLNSGFVMSASGGIVMYNFYSPVVSRLGGIRNKNLRSAIAAWVTGTVGMMPVCAFFFNGMSLYSIICSLFYIPIVLAIIVIAPAALFLYEFLGNAWFVGTILDGLIELMKRLPQMIALLPGSYITVGKTTVLGFCIIFSGAVLLKYWLERRYKELMFKVSLGAVVFLLAIHTAAIFSDIGTMYVNFVNVGQGDGAVINIKGKETVLIDGGGGSGESEYNVGEEVFLPYLTAKGLSRIDLAVVSHFHRDHCEGIIAAVENLRVGSVMVNDKMQSCEFYKQLVQAAEKTDTELIVVSSGDRVEFDSGMVMTVLSPEDSYLPEDENDTSLVIKIEYLGRSFFFGGDITKETEKKILGKIGKTDVVKASHHGSKNSSSAEFAEETSPEYVVFSAGENNMYGHPTYEAIDSFSKAGASVLRTDMMGDIEFCVKKNGKLKVDWYKEDKSWR